MLKMNVDELAALYDNLSDLIVQGKEGDAREYLARHLPRLPEELRNEILGQIFVGALVDEAREIEAVAGIQEQGISAIHALKALKKEIEKGKGAAT